MRRAQRGVIAHDPGTELLGPDFSQTLPYPVLDNGFAPPTVQLGDAR